LNDVIVNVQLSATNKLVLVYFTHCFAHCILLFCFCLEERQERLYRFFNDL